MKKLVNGELVDMSPREIKELDAANTAWFEARNNYASLRRREYPQVVDQLDMLYKDLASGADLTKGSWFQEIKSIKEKYPKNESTT